MAWGTRVHRVLAAATDRYGQEAVDRLYAAIGQRIHERGAERDATTLTEAIAEAALPAELASAARRRHAGHGRTRQSRRGIGPGHVETGSPVTALDDGPGFFGPVVVPIPEGHDADRLFEALRLLATVPQLSELKRVRNSF